MCFIIPFFCRKLRDNQKTTLQKMNYFKPSLIFATGLSLLMVFNSQSQKWVDLMLGESDNLYEIQKSFSDYWSNRSYQKGNGYKQFKRWEYYAEQRVYPTGDLRLLSQTYPNYLEWLETQQLAGVSTPTYPSWRLIGPTGKPSGGGAGRLNFVRFDPTNSNIIYVGAPDGGLWKSTDGGTNWSTNTDKLTVIGMSDIVFDPTNNQTMYVATGDGDGGDSYSVGV